jgi:hypothetical protein
MKPFCLLLALSLCGGFARAQSTLETIGVNPLRAADPTLTGSGVNVAQIESAPNPLQFEVNPHSPAQPGRLFTYWSVSGGATGFPNGVGSESSHSDSVAQNFYGTAGGAAPGVGHVSNYETKYFYATIIQRHEATNSRVFNQSFEFGGHNAAQDAAYDNYIAEYHTLVASGVGNGGPILTPADCYNGLGVAAYGGSSSVGPSADGRCKPDITAPAGETSFSTPFVSGAAALLIEGGRRMGVNSAAAIDSRTVKALLLTGAVKPAGWTHRPAAPLDYRYGAGVLNVFNSYAELAGGRHRPVASGLTRAGHAPLTSGTFIAAESGWDYRGIDSAVANAGANHYRIMASGSGALIATLDWNKGNGASAINRLELYVYNANGELLSSSISAVDNVQHVYLTGLTAGIYELEVVKIAGPEGSPGVTAPREVYALAWDFGR